MVWLAELLPAVGSAGTVLLAAGWPSWRGWQPVVGIDWQDTHPMESHHSTDGASLLDLKDKHASHLSDEGPKHTVFGAGSGALMYMGRRVGSHFLCLCTLL